MNLINPTYDPAAGEKFDIDFLFVFIKNILKCTTLHIVDNLVRVYVFCKG